MILIKHGLIYKNNVFIKQDVLIDNEKIVEIAPNIDPTNQKTVIDAHDMIVVPGFIDMHTHLREPGYEYKETILTGSMAAARGGFTTIAAMPNTNPVIDNLDIINNIKHLIEKAYVKVLLYSSITKMQLGKELVDFSELAPSVIAFSDDGNGIQDETLMKEALENAKAVNKILVCHCEDQKLIPRGASLHGEKSIPSSSEYEQVFRDLNLVKEINTRYHICHVSTKETVALVRETKKNGLSVTCEVTPHHLLLCDEDVFIDNANFKMNPPLRSKEDKEALIAGLNDGTIDIIATDHAPHSVAEKNQDFDKAPFGVIGLETCFPVLYTNLVLKKIITLNQLLDALAYKPSEIFKLQSGIDIGKNADLTLINLKQKQIIDSSLFYSLSRNTPFNGYECNGVIKFTIVNGKIVYQGDD